MNGGEDISHPDDAGANRRHLQGAGVTEFMKKFGYADKSGKADRMQLASRA